MQITLPAIQSTGGEGGIANYADTIDSLYQIYNARLIQLNVPNARNDGTHNSQAEWGLADIIARRAQNNSWNTQYAISTVSGTGALEVYSITRNFDLNIQKINSAAIKAALYWNVGTNYGFFNSIVGPYGSIQSFNEITDVIDTIADATALVPTTKNQHKSYIATNTNKFAIIANGLSFSSYAVDGNNTISSAVAADTETLTTIKTITAVGTTVVKEYAFVIAAKNQYVWIGQVLGHGIDGNASATGGEVGFRVHLYSIDSVGNFTLVNSGSTTTYTNTAVASGITAFAMAAYGGYVAGNTAHVFVTAAGYEDGSTNMYQRMRIYFTVDLSVTGSVSQSIVRNDNTAGTNASWINGTTNYWGTDGEYLVGHNGTHLLVVVDTKDIFEVNNASGFVDTTSNYFSANYNDPCRYKNTVSKLSTATNNIHIISNTLYVNNVATNGTLTNLNTNSIILILVDGTNQEDTSTFAGWQINCTIQNTDISQETIALVLSANGVDVGTKTLELYPAQTGNRINTAGPTFDDEFFETFNVSNQSINATNIKLRLYTANANSRDIKIGFGLTGGTYASPTGTNNMTGSSTTGANVGSNGSYMDIEI